MRGRAGEEEEEGAEAEDWVRVGEGGERIVGRDREEGEETERDEGGELKVRRGGREMEWGQGEEEEESADKKNAVAAGKEGEGRVCGA